MPRAVEEGLAIQVAVVVVEEAGRELNQTSQGVEGWAEPED